MIHIKEYYDKVLAQSHTIAKMLLEGQYADWKHLHLNKDIDSTLIKAVLNTTNCTKDVGTMIIC